MYKHIHPCGREMVCVDSMSHIVCIQPHCKQYVLLYSYFVMVIQCRKKSSIYIKFKSKWHSILSQHQPLIYHYKCVSVANFDINRTFFSALNDHNKIWTWPYTILIIKLRTLCWNDVSHFVGLHCRTLAISQVGTFYCW